ncbi:protein kinase domain-containing protein [Inhella crocodyli]|uniref:HDOD domain-containing protein n=1 Tax=Inhella crocodyli TaxID=2499851 RepID=A0A437LQ25_9BURK|nr:HDOD domain-containing protein [Inhella crocodyli]RVT87520.1 HDOD domain-containing protein [Inhella crocodyli]
MSQMLGRFKLERELGRGAQAVVWLAHDPRLDREVALKIMSAGASKAAVDEWLQEGRAVSRLNHPGIVQVFEADVIDGKPVLVFELVHGGTLLPLLRRAPLPARQAVDLMVAVLDALAVAHAAGVVHRDLKPSNILLDPQGRPRVTDFGIAARVTDAKAAAIVGTPSYISPEAARGEPPQPRMDVFAAAIMLGELLSGQRLNHDADPMRCLQRVLAEDLQLPPMPGSDVDDELRLIVQRGLSRDPGARWDGAGAMRDALLRWLQGPEGDTPESGEAQAAALEFLMRRMRSKADFPGLSASIERIHRVTQSDKESLSGLSNEILKDVALTNKLLRLVNTAQFRHAGGGTINTISRAVALIGFAGVRNLALSLVLLERMQDRTHADQLKTEFLRSLMAGSLAREFTGGTREGEEMFLGALFQNLGRLLCAFYFPEEAQQVRRLVREGEGTRSPVSEATASTRVLGITFEELGVGIAKRWGLPDALTTVMRRPAGEPPAKAVDVPAERQRWLCRAANDTADLILSTPPEQLAGPLGRLAESHGKALKLPTKAFEAACEEARKRLASMADAMEIKLEKKSIAHRLMPTQEPAAPGAGGAPGDDLATMVLPPDAGPAPVEQDPVERRAHATQQLAAGIQDITDAMVESQDLGAVLRMILETIYRALGVRRVLFCLRDARTDTLVGRFGVGEALDVVVPQMRIPLRSNGQPDLFATICTKGVDTLISDATQPSIAQRLPAWYAKPPLQAGCFLLLPLTVKNAPLGLIYADSVAPGGIQLSEKELSLLRTLRNQAVMAFRQNAG